MINIINKRIREGKFVFIAEIGVNYYDIARKENITPMEAAKLMIKKAKEAGVHAVKFQTYKAGTLAAKESPSYWDTTEEATTSQYLLFKKFDSFGEEQYRELSEYCEGVGIEFLSTPFDIESADYLYDMMNVYKISSSDLNNTPFVEYIARKNKPIILSVGASNKDEIDRTLKLISANNDKKVILLHCVLEYPTPYEHANLNKISSLAHEYTNCAIGYSDHTKPEADYAVLQTAYNLGAKVIEKHFTLDKSLPGNDHYHAMDDNDAKRIIERIKYLDLIRGSYDLIALPSEMTARQNARRSVVAKVNIPEGTILQEDMLTFKRPGTGISASDFNKIVGMKARKGILEDSILTWEMLN